MSREHIGFIGLGIMGSAMAANLVKAGYELAVWNRSREKARPLEEMGARFLEPRELAAQSSIVISMLAHPQAVSETMLGGDADLSAMPEGSLWIDCSTVHPSFSTLEAEQAEVHGVRFLDAPVAGSRGPAERGELVFLVGGEADEVKRAQPLFDVMGKVTRHMGGTSAGSAMKMSVNYMLALSMVGFAEASALAKSAGISEQQIFDTLIGGPVAAPFLGGKREKIESGDYGADFPLKWMHKDLHLAALTGYELEVPMQAANSVKEIFAEALRDGYGDKDFSSIYAYLNRSR